MASSRAALYRPARPLVAALMLSALLATSACGTSHSTSSAAGTTVSATAPTSSSGSAPSTSETATASSAPPASASKSSSSRSSSVPGTVAAHTLVTASPIPLTSTASFGTSVTARIVKTATIQAKAQQPGEISGPAVALTISIENNSQKSIDLTYANVTVQDKAGTPSTPMTSSPARPFTGQLAAGRQATAVYVFSLPAHHINPITVGLSYTTTAPVVLFVGDPQ